MFRAGLDTWRPESDMYGLRGHTAAGIWCSVSHNRATDVRVSGQASSGGGLWWAPSHLCTLHYESWKYRQATSKARVQSNVDSDILYHSAVLYVARVQPIKHHFQLWLYPAFFKAVLHQDPVTRD